MTHLSKEMKEILDRYSEGKPEWEQLSPQVMDLVAPYAEVGGGIAQAIKQAEEYKKEGYKVEFFLNWRMGKIKVVKVVEDSYASNKAGKLLLS